MAYLGTAPNLIQYSNDSFTGNGSTTSFTLTFIPNNSIETLVFIDGAYQTPAIGNNTNNYSVASQTLVFTSAPPNDSNISVIYLGVNGTAGSNISGVVYSGNPSTSTIPVVTSTNNVTYEAAALVRTVLGSVPTITIYTSSSGTYTTPANALYLRVRMIGGGGGGGGGGSGGTPGSGTAGSASTFSGGATSMSAGGGAAGSQPGNGTPSGGTSSGGNINASGGVGQNGQFAIASKNAAIGGNGGDSAFGGGGVAVYDNTGGNAASNSGGGGAGGGATLVNGVHSGNGGGAGAYCEAIISSPATSYSYAVGAGGSGGAGGTDGSAGGNGGSGFIIVEAFYM